MLAMVIFAPPKGKTEDTLACLRCEFWRERIRLRLSPCESRSPACIIGEINGGAEKGNAFLLLSVD
jgi:hypothetical protein